MSNSEHMRRLLESSDTEWNDWRERSPEIRPDFSGAEFKDVGFVGWDFRSANFQGGRFARGSLAYANFTGADLEHAAFEEVDLQSADFTSARLHRTTLQNSRLELATFAGAELEASLFLGASLVLDGVDFRSARMTSLRLDEARLRNASFQRSVLWQVSLRKADFDSAAFELTILADCDLHTAALDAAAHLGPSVVDQRTLARSGEISRVFLHGCGLSDAMLATLPRETGSIGNLYIVYDGADVEFAERLDNDLQAAGVRCWLRPLGTKLPFCRWEPEERLLHWNRILLILSEASQYRSAFERLVVEMLDGRADHFAAAPKLFAVRVDGGSGGHVADVYGKLRIEDLSALRAGGEQYASAVARLVARIRAR